jgi:protein-tyrosine kinase
MSKIRKALDKAQQTRKESFIETKDEGPVRDAVESPSAFTPETTRGTRPEYIRPNYYETKVQNVDFQNLEEKRIISICHDNLVADRIKILRTQILQTIQENKRGNTLLIASANPGEGRSLIAANLAISISQQIDGTVLLVDADLRKPSIHELFELDVEGGLSEYLKKKAELPNILVNPGIPRLVILPGGKPVNNSSELLSSPRMQSLVKEIKERYPDRFIIFDSPPLLTSADPLVLARYMDGIIIVVEAEKTKKDDLTRIFELLKDRPVIGTVFNKARE